MLQHYKTFETANSSVDRNYLYSRQLFSQQYSFCDLLHVFAVV